LFGYYEVDNNNFVKHRNFYRFYLLIYLILFVCYLYFN
jgi:hypothetical protein